MRRRDTARVNSSYKGGRRTGAPAKAHSVLKLFTQFHVLISLLGILAGFVVIFGMLGNERLDTWNLFFLVMTVATSATGYLFPFKKLLPSHIVGVISLLVLGLAIYARYPAHLTGSFVWIYVVCAVFAQYLNFFVLIVQGFQKVPALNKLAPTQTETPFKISQGVALLVFVALGVGAVLAFHPWVNPPIQ